MVGIGVIGFGSRMQSMLNHLSEVIGDKAPVVGIYDVNESNAKKCRNIYGNGVIIYNDPQELMNDSRVNWVFIGSPNQFHKEQIISAFEAKKHVFSEKPLAISVDECYVIKQSKKHTNSKFLISYPLRESPHYSKIKEIIDSGKIGKITSLEFNETLSFEHGCFIMSDWRRRESLSGGHLLEKCCHDIDLVNWILGSLPKKVASFGGLDFFKPDYSSVYDDLVRNKQSIIFRDKIRKNPFTTDKDIVDNQVVILEYENGVHATFHTNLSSGLPERRMYICGTKGTLRANVLTGEIEVNSSYGSQNHEFISDSNSAEMHGGGDRLLAKKLYDFMNDDYGSSHDDTSLDDAIQSAVSAIMIDEARKKGEVLDLSETWKKFGY